MITGNSSDTITIQYPWNYGDSPQPEAGDTFILQKSDTWDFLDDCGERDNKADDGLLENTTWDLNEPD